MCEHEHKTCPRCAAVFDCRPDDITKCQCYAVTLNDAERDLLAGRYTDCLCADCLQAERSAYHHAQQKIQLKENAVAGH